MRYILPILTILLFTGATKQPDETSLPWHRSFYDEMKKLEKPGRVTAYANVQTANNTTLTGTTCNVTVSSTTANNLVVVTITLFSTVAPSSVTDNAGNTYLLGKDKSIANSYRMAMYYGFQISGGATTITGTVASSTDFVVMVDEYSGFTGTPTNAECFCIAADNYCFSAASCGATIEPCATGNLMVGSVFDDNSAPLGAGTGYTLSATSSYYGYAYSKTNYKLSSSGTESVAFTITGSGFNTQVIGMAFKQEGEPGPPGPAGKAIRSAGN